ncbi:MAG: CHAT domain-containing protein [Oculatellaceae cyanobacterium bins.114]|nr:CHAT domain-containing protein [Oculatellaceae cyanobacterium bins.114]
MTRTDLLWISLIVASSVAIAHQEPLIAQSITAAPDGTGTVVQRSGGVHTIQGGSLSGDGRNLFHSFERFGLSAEEVANFLSTPQIQTILGRVTGGDPSIINGLLRVSGGNSDLYLINPAGILFGANARLDIPASFTATTATGIGFGDSSWSAFASSDYSALIGQPTSFVFNTDAPGAIANFGTLAVNPGEQLTLIGGTVLNVGTLLAPGGVITIAAVPGENRVRLSQSGMLLSLELETLNSADAVTEVALPFTPLLLPELLTGGSIETASQIQVNADGTVQLTGSGTPIAPTPGTAILTGRLDAANLTSSSPSLHPEVNIVGDRIALLSANLDASSLSQGGTIRIGGDYQGQGNLPTAQITYIDLATHLRADGISSLTGSAQANGGRVIVWADQTTRFDGSITARGGELGGNGGFVEVSGLQNLALTGTVNTLAPNGLAGTLLLDPADIVVVTPFSLPPAFTALSQVDGFADPDITPNTLDVSLINNALTNVTLQATNDITFSAPINIQTGGVGLTALANNNISVNTTITTRGGNLTLIGDNDNSGSGVVRVDTGQSIATNGGAVTIRGRNATNTFASGVGASILSPIDSGGGDIQITGESTSATGLSSFQGDRGINLGPGAPLNSGGGDITLTASNVQQQGIVAFDPINSGGGDVRITVTSATNNNLTLLDPVNAGAGDIVITTNELTRSADATLLGSGDITIQPFTPSRAIALGNTSPVPISGALDLGTLVDGLSGFNRITIGRANSSGVISLTGPVQVSDPLTLRSPLGSIDTTGGSLLGLDNATITLLAGTSLVTGDVTNPGRAITLTSQNGRVDTQGGLIDTGNEGTNDGGAIAITAASDIVTTRLNTSVEIGTAGAIALTSTNGSITLNGDTLATATTGNGGEVALTAQRGFVQADTIRTSATANAGDVTITAQDSITTGDIETESSSGNAGDVTLDPNGDVQVNTINAQSATGNGGTVNITTRQFFRALSTFRDRNNILASISTADSTSGGAVTIRHGGGDTTAFIVGGSTPNGTRGSITSGGTTLRASPPQTLQGDFIEGNIQVLTDDNPPPPPPPPPPPGLQCPPNCPPDIAPPPSFIPSTPSSRGNDNPYFAPSLPSELFQAKDLNLVRTTLLELQTAAQIKTALIYISFIPADLVAPADYETLETNAIQQYQQYLQPNSSVTHAPGSWQPQDSDQLELLIITATGEPIRRLVPEVTRGQVRQVADRFRQQVTDRASIRANNYLSTAQQLYQWLIAPIQSDLAANEIQTLSFILDPGLRSLPLAALYDGKQFLVEQYSVNLMPSISLIDASYVSLNNVQLLAMGASEFTEFVPLPAVPIELETITSTRSGELFLNDSFTLANLRLQRNNRGFGIVHLATHAEFRPGQPNNSFIQLWDQKLQLDQFRLLNLYNPPVELLVLSACRTALGDNQAELGFAGLALQAGVKSALASLWYVSDEGSLAFMTEFYRQLQTAPTKAEALRQTQLAMIRGEVQLVDGQLRGTEDSISLPANLAHRQTINLTHPFFWSAFTLIGSPW